MGPARVFCMVDSHSKFAIRLFVVRRTRNERSDQKLVVIARATCPPKLAERRRKRDEAIRSLPRGGLLRGACHRAALRADPLARNDACQTFAAHPRHPPSFQTFPLSS